MQVVDTTPDQDAAIVAVLGVVATAGGEEPPSEADQTLIRAAADHLLGGADVPTTLATALSDEVIDALGAGEARDLAMQIATILCFADIREATDGKQAYLDPARVDALYEAARRVGVDEDDVDELQRLAKHHRALVTYDLFRRYLSSKSGEHLPMLRTTLEQADAALAVDRDEHEARWRLVERLPGGTVGAELIRYYHEHNWAYPGTNRHQPLAFAEHDFHHVLGGYATTPSGELRVGAFTAGVADRPVDCALFFLTWEQLGIGSRAIPGAVGAFEPEPFFSALERGANTTRDFIGVGWDPWSIVDRNLEEMREQYRIGPGAQLSPGDPYDQNPPASAAA